MSYVCSARASVASITKNVEALAEEYGNPVELAGETRSTLPAPEVLAQASESRLWELGLGFQGLRVMAFHRSIQHKSRTNWATLPPIAAFHSVVTPR